MAILVQLALTTTILEEAVERSVVEEIRFEDYCIFKSGDIGVRLWVPSTTSEEFETGLEEDVTASSYEIIAQTSSKSLYQIQLSKHAQERSIVPLLGEFGGEIIDSKRADDQWIVQLRFPDHATVQEFLSSIRSLTDVSLRIERIHRKRSVDDQSFGLTPEQHEALRAAYEQGYFDIPREATLKLVSDELGVSDQAVSERLRRAQKRVCEHLL